MKPEKGHIHFIAIGGSAMHNLAIALKNMGYRITGSDDDIFEPSKTKLRQSGLLPASLGWYPEKIKPQTKAVILGMHAREDNPELIRARKLGIPVHSFPDYIYQATQDALRVVIAGSHGKTTITSMIMHVLKGLHRDFDYLVGAGIEGFENMVQLSSAPLIVLEGDEYWSSVLDKTPKFIRYNHHIGLLSGIAWDHINAFPTHKDYVDQFRQFLYNTPDDGAMVYNQEDLLLGRMIENFRKDVKLIPYVTPEYKVFEHKYVVSIENDEVPVEVIGKHNMQNLAGAIEILKLLNIDIEEIKKHISSFKGANNRLQKLSDQPDLVIYKDFAHSPSKLKSTTQAVKELYPDKNIVNCFELHTYSSLNRSFLEQYRNTLNPEDTNVIFINDHTLKIKRLEYLDDDTIKNKFNDPSLIVIRTKESLESFILENTKLPSVLLLMSSGNFGGLNLDHLVGQLVKK